MKTYFKKSHKISVKSYGERKTGLKILQKTQFDSESDD